MRLRAAQNAGKLGAARPTIEGKSKRPLRDVAVVAGGPVSRDERRKERIALNESAYREMNEWIIAGQGALESLTILCECGHEDCSDILRLSSDEYQSVRESALRFVMSPDHLIPDAEFRVEERSGCWVVEKFKEVADVTEATDPRSRDLPT